MFSSVLVILLIFVITLLGGYVRLCLFGSFNLGEATVLILAMDFGFLVSYIVSKLIKIDEDYEELLYLFFAGVFSLVGEIIYQKKRKIVYNDHDIEF